MAERGRGCPIRQLGGKNNSRPEWGESVPLDSNTTAALVYRFVDGGGEMIEDQLERYAAVAEMWRKQAAAIESLRLGGDAVRSARAMEEALRPVLELQRLMEPYAQLRRMGEEIRQVMAAQSAMWDTTARRMIELQEWWERLPPKLKWAYSVIGSVGWYSDDDMPVDQPIVLAEAIEAGEVEEVEQLLEEHFEARATSIEASLAELFPDRRVILGKAFSAHHRGDFELSVPVFLAQADGICSDRCGEKLFGRSRGKPRTAKYVEQVAANAFQEATLHFLSEPMPISASPDSPDFVARSLNRHAVLHGTSTTYGTKRNSLKAISLLQYLVSALATPAEANDSTASK